MMTRRLLVCSVAALVLSNAAAYADEPKNLQDTVTFTLSSEDWVSTKTARVIINVEAAVNGATAGTARADMLKAVEGVAKADWKLTGFSRSQDQTGLERWSASFEARLPENALGGIHEAAKKAGKAGMQLSIAEIDFSPTLDETEAARATLRTKIYKSASEQLATLNATLPGRSYRIAEITFLDAGMPQIYTMKAMSMPNRRMAAMATSAGAPPESDAAMAMQRSEKISVSAAVVFASAPTQSATTGEAKR